MDARAFLIAGGFNEAEDNFRMTADALWTLAEKGEDPEADHSDADKLLLIFLRSLGFNEIADAFEEVDKWYA